MFAEHCQHADDRCVIEAGRRSSWRSRTEKPFFMKDLTAAVEATLARSAQFEHWTPKLVTGPDG